MKTALAGLALLGTLTAFVTNSNAGGYHAAAVCKAGHGHQAFYHNSGFVSNHASDPTYIICPIKEFVGNGTPTTYSLTAGVWDGNGANTTDTNSRCELQGNYYGAGGGAAIYGGWSTSSTAHSETALSLSVYDPHGLSGWIVLVCWLGKNDASSGEHSKITFIYNTSW